MNVLEVLNSDIDLGICDHCQTLQETLLVRVLPFKNSILLCALCFRVFEDKAEGGEG